MVRGGRDETKRFNLTAEFAEDAEKGEISRTDPGTKVLGTRNGYLRVSKKDRPIRSGFACFAFSAVKNPG